MAKIVAQGKSMAPLLLPKDSLLIEKKSVYELDDILVFKQDKKFIAHRAIYIRDGEFLTKGDNNSRSDGFVGEGEILGHVTGVRRGKENILIKHFYLTQSANYLRELSKVAKAFSKSNLPYVFIKGLPVHLFTKNSPPQRIYIDADVLIEKDKKILAIKLLKKLGFKSLKDKSLYVSSSREPTQLTFYKSTISFPVVIDLHLDIPLGFTRASAVNDLLPATNKFIEDIIRESVSLKIGSAKFKIPRKEYIFITFLIHFFHHNLKGAASLKSLAEISKGGLLDFSEVGKLIKRHKLENFLFPAALVLDKYYPELLPKKFFKAIKLDFGEIAISYLIKFFSWPFSEEERLTAGIKRFCYLFLLSPKRLDQKLMVLLKKEALYYYGVSIRSFFLSIAKKLFTSLVALVGKTSN